MKVLSLIILLALWPTQNQPTDLDRFGESVFIGQAYPSGNVYLRPFSGDTTARPFWPASLSLIAVGETKPDLPPVRRGVFNRALANQTENDVVKSLYIPGVEGMDEDHDACGLGEVAKANPAHQLLSLDFFQAMFDHCEPNDGTALYRTSSSKYSVMVIGVPDNLSLVNSKVTVEKSPPVAPAQGVQIFEASTREGNLTLRISTYETAGNGGHLASAYVLEVLRNGQLLRKFELFQPRGAL